MSYVHPDFFVFFLDADPHEGVCDPRSFVLVAQAHALFRKLAVNMGLPELAPRRVPDRDDGLDF